MYESSYKWADFVVDSVTLRARNRNEPDIRSNRHRKSRPDTDRAFLDSRGEL